MVEILLLVVTGLLVVVIGFAAAFTIRTTGAAPSLPAVVSRLPFRQLLAVLFWLLMLGVSALLTWADESPVHLDGSTIVSLVLVGAFFCVPAWRAADRFQGKPWSRGMTIDFTISVVSLVFSGWGLIELALRDAEELQSRLLAALIIVLLLVLLLPVGLRRLIGVAPVPRRGG